MNCTTVVSWNENERIFLRVAYMSRRQWEVTHLDYLRHRVEACSENRVHEVERRIKHSWLLERRSRCTRLNERQFADERSFIWAGSRSATPRSGMNTKWSLDKAFLQQHTRARLMTWSLLLGRHGLKRKQTWIVDFIVFDHLRSQIWYNQ